MKQHDRAEHLLGEIQSAQQVIEQCTYDNPYPYTVGALTSMLAGMAGLGDYATHGSCFDSEVTQAIQELLETINQQ